MIQVEATAATFPAALNLASPQLASHDTADHWYQSRMILLGCSCALERVCGFSMEMAHQAQMGIEGTVTLPMSRYDIADYLAIAVETVSRSLTTLRCKRVITLFLTRGTFASSIARPSKRIPNHRRIP